MTWPKVSFVTATCGRPPAHLHLLQEAAESFRLNALDYPGEAELVLVNDCPNQELACAVPGVRAINLPRRFATLGEKLNFGIEAASGAVILPQDDDDVSLSHRARLSVERLGDAEYFNPLAYFFLCGDRCQFEQRTGYAHNCSAFRKSAWARVGGYPHVSGPQDAHMDGALRRLCATVQGPLSRDECFFVYRWGVSDLHLSAFGDTEGVYRERGLRPFPAGRWEITPRWLRDYPALCRSAASPP